LIIAGFYSFNNGFESVSNKYPQLFEEVKKALITLLGGSLIAVGFKTFIDNA
jgi:hypothetical protein